MISSLVLVLLPLFSRVAAVPAGDTGVNSSLTSSFSNVQPTVPAVNETSIYNNETVNDARFNVSWQYDSSDECDWTMKYIPSVGSECTEYCDADTYDWGFQYHRLRYHIKLSGNGQDPGRWCDNFKARMMRNCGVGKPDFFNCNSGRAPELPGLRKWAMDTAAGKVVQMPGINLRFDFNPRWNPRDAQHDCVRSAIREATCAGTLFSNGLRCIPTLYVAPNSKSLEFDESYVPPYPRCLHSYEVPEEAR